MSDTAAPVEKTDKDIINELSAGLDEVLDRYEALAAQYKVQEAELALAKSQLKAMFEGNVGIGVLQEMALDPNTEPNLRHRCARDLAQTERPKLSAVMTNVVAPKLFDILEARRNAGKVIEQAPAGDRES
jgi:hypothetical protein